MRQVTLADIRTMARTASAGIRLNAMSANSHPHIYLHWSAGHYGQPFSDYHLNIDHDGTIYTDTDDLAEIKSHTWRHNSGSIGISLLCAYNATPYDLGPEPPTEEQIEAAAQVIAVLADELGIPIDNNHVLTHAEQADRDNYGPESTWERWDLWILHVGDEPGSGGDILRGKAIYYQNYGGLT